MSWFSFHFPDFALSFLSIIFEGIPFLLLGSLVSGAVEAFVPRESLTRWLPKNLPGRQSCASALMGLVLPMCECASVVVIRRLIRKGFPIPCAITYMMGAPIVSPVVALSTYAAFRGQSPIEMTFLRLLLGFLIAVGIGMLVRDIPPEKLLQPEMLESLGAGDGGGVGRRRTGLSMAAAPVDSSLDLTNEGIKGKLFRHGAIGDLRFPRRGVLLRHRRRHRLDLQHRRRSKPPAARGLESHPLRGRDDGALLLPRALQFHQCLHRGQLPHVPARGEAGLPALRAGLRHEAVLHVRGGFPALVRPEPGNWTFHRDRANLQSPGAGP